MSHQKQSEKLSRRGFLKSAAVAGGAAGVATLGSQVQAVEEQPSAERAEAPSKGYRETPHVREYYAKARF
ncbi:MAG TPA: twin-arginine translocation signal domain-containing protein [Arenicellales bacterium]|nr:twin-arginine translocation signal domain-containing protein [Arenicellales bacterium]